MTSNCLTLRDSPNAFGVRLRHALDYGFKSDLSLTCGGQIFRVHRVILGTASNLVKKLAADKYAVISEDISPKTLGHLIEYLYFGTAELPADLLPEFKEHYGNHSEFVQAYTMDGKVPTPPTPHRGRWWITSVIENGAVP